MIVAIAKNFCVKLGATTYQSSTLLVMVSVAKIVASVVNVAGCGRLWQVVVTMWQLWQVVATMWRKLWQVVATMWRKTASSWIATCICVAVSVEVLGVAEMWQIVASFFICGRLWQNVVECGGSV